jgi:hypothetical protein
MSTGDRVLALLAVKGACCGLLALAASGSLGGAFAWFMDRSVGSVLGAALAIGIAAVIWRSGGTKSGATEATSAKAAETPNSDAAAQQLHQIP